MHHGNPPEESYPVSFALLLNLVQRLQRAQSRCAVGLHPRAMRRSASPKHNPGLDRLVDHAIRYYDDFVKPPKIFRAPDDKERAALNELADMLDGMEDERDGETVQFEIYEIGKRHHFEPLRDWFKAIYEVVIGQTQGPRFGSFAALFGCAETAALIRARAGRRIPRQHGRCGMKIATGVVVADPACGTGNGGGRRRRSSTRRASMTRRSRPGPAEKTAQGFSVAARAELAEERMRPAALPGLPEARRNLCPQGHRRRSDTGRASGLSGRRPRLPGPHHRHGGSEIQRLSPKRPRTISTSH